MTGGCSCASPPPPPWRSRWGRGGNVRTWPAVARSTLPAQGRGTAGAVTGGAAAPTCCPAWPAPASGRCAWLACTTPRGHHRGSGVPRPGRRPGLVARLRRTWPATPDGLARGPLGLGTDFESVRDYTPDDDIRQLNWRATARVGRPMSNQYRLERDRDVVCLVDCGRLMAAPAEPAPCSTPR